MAGRDYLTTAVTDDRLEAVCRWRDKLVHR